MRKETVLQKPKSYLLIASMIWAFGFSKAQIGLNQTYIEGRSVLLFSSIEFANNELYVIGTSGEVGTLSSYDRLFYGVIDSNGMIKRHVNVYDSVPKSYSAYLNALSINGAGDLIYTGNTFDTTVRVGLLRINTITDSFVINEYYTPNTYAFYGAKVIQVGCDYFIAGVRTDATVNSADNVLLKIDTIGNRLWQKQYGANNRLEYARSLIELTNGNLMMGSFRSDFNQTNEKSNTWLLEVDTGGNIVRQWFDPSDSTYVAEGLRQTQDGGFIYGAQKKGEQTVNDVYKTAIIVKLDSNFNKQWVHHCNIISSYTAVTDIEELADGSIIACGNKPYYQTDSNTVSGWIIKLDKDGNVFWDRVYRGINLTQTLNLLTDVDILPNGGLIAVGQCQLSGATPPQVGWFLKLDSNGCEVENCVLSGPSPLNPPKGDLMQVWPNPADSYVEVMLPDEMQNAELKIFDVTGTEMMQKRIMEEKTVLDVSAFSIGLYFVTAQKGERVWSTKLIVE